MEHHLFVRTMGGRVSIDDSVASGWQAARLHTVLYVSSRGTTSSQILIFIIILFEGLSLNFSPFRMHPTHLHPCIYTVPFYDKKTISLSSGYST